MGPAYLVLAGSLLPVMAQAFGGQDTWTRGWGQGVSEFVIKGKGQSQLSLACEDYGSQPATVIFTDASGYLSSKNKETILPAALCYGQSVRVSFYNNCVASEVVVTTDKGGWRYTYH